MIWPAIIIAIIIPNRFPDALQSRYVQV